MNTQNTIQVSRQIPLTHQEIHFLEKKRKTSALALLPYTGLPIIGFALYAAGFPLTLFYLTIISALFAFLSFKEARTIWRINKDLRGNHKVAFEAEIEDYKQTNQTNRDGEITDSKYYFVAGGKKYEVGADVFYKSGRGDTVKITVAPASRHAFDVEKIRSAEKSRQPNSLFHFTSPLS